MKAFCHCQNMQIGMKMGTEPVDFGKTVTWNPCYQPWGQGCVLGGVVLLGL